MDAAASVVLPIHDVSSATDDSVSDLDDDSAPFSDTRPVNSNAAILAALKKLWPDKIC